jgi:hypothetical protein
MASPTVNFSDQTSLACSYVAASVHKMQAKSRMDLWSEPLSFWGMEASLASTSYHAIRLEMLLYSAGPRKPYLSLPTGVPSGSALNLVQKVWRKVKDFRGLWHGQS